MMKRIFQWASAWFQPVPTVAAENHSPAASVAKISVMTSGRILLEDRVVSVGEVKKALEGVKAKGGAVWYYRESGQGEPPAQAVEVFKLIVESKIPVSLSTQRDFSDYVDEQGLSQPRK